MYIRLSKRIYIHSFISSDLVIIRIFHKKYTFIVIFKEVNNTWCIIDSIQCVLLQCRI